MVSIFSKLTKYSFDMFYSSLLENIELQHFRQENGMKTLIFGSKFGVLSKVDGRSGVKLDGSKVRKWTVMYETGRSKKP